MTKLNKTVYAGERVDLMAEVPLKGPLLVHLETTNRCNFKCTFCPESLDNYREETGGLFLLGEPDYQRIIDQLGELGGPKMLALFTFGDPFMNKKMNQYIRYAHDNLPGTQLFVSTNGELLTEEKFKGLCESGLDNLRVSIFGHNDEHHRKNTQRDLPLSKIRDNIRAFCEYRDANGFEKPHVNVKSIASPVEEHNQEFMKYFEGIGDDVVLEGLSNWNDDGSKFSSTYGVDQENLLQSEYFKNVKDVCPYPFYSFVIHSDMTVSICCIDWNKKTKIGDLSKQSIKEIWEGEELYNFQMAHLERRKNDLEGCRNCTYFYTLTDDLDAMDPDEFAQRVEKKRQASTAD